jgi:hypothetical protein
MTSPKYIFYIGAANSGLYFNPGTGIDDNGEFISAVGKYSYGPEELVGNKLIFINLDSTEDYYNSILFYDSSESFISYEPIKGPSIFAPPANAKYYALRFTSSDKAFMSKKDTNFVYYVQQVNPHYKELSKKYAKENGQEFFRISLEGKINLFNRDFELVYYSSVEDQMVLLVNKYNRDSSKWEEYYKGEFNKTDCKFDYAKGSCELKTTALDDYSSILYKYENTYDLIKLAPQISKIHLCKRPLIQIYVAGSNSITNFFGGVYWEDDVKEPVDSISDLLTKYHFAYIKTGNEFYIKNAGIPQVNGVYAGMDGVFTQEQGCTCYFGSIEPNVATNVYIKRNSDDVILYKSVNQYTGSGGYIGREDVEMVNVNDSTDRFYIESPFVYRICKRVLCDVDEVEVDGEVKTTSDLPSDDFVVDNRNYKKCIGLEGGLFFCTTATDSEPTKYGINDYGQYFTNKFIPSTAGLGRPLPISRSSWANASLWYVYDNSYEVFDEKLRKEYTLKDSYSIASVISALLKEIDPTIKHLWSSAYSRFLYDTNVPMPMDRFYLYITQKTNVLKGDYDQPAQKAEISLEAVLKMLRDCFRCYWFIEDGKFRIEHISFFMNGGNYFNYGKTQLDFTELKDQFNKKPYSYFQSEIEFDKSDLNSRYEFNWMDDVTDLFAGLTIDIKSNYIQKGKTEEINISNFSSDIDYMLLNPPNFSEDGFALLCPVYNGAYFELPIIKTELLDENGDRYNAIIQNYYASWAYLIRFYLYDMPASSLHCNVLGDLYANGIKHCMHNTIEFPSEEDPDRVELIKTPMGYGRVEEILVNMLTRIAKVKLSYAPK